MSKNVRKVRMGERGCRYPTKTLCTGRGGAEMEWRLGVRIDALVVLCGMGWGGSCCGLRLWEKLDCGWGAFCVD